MSQKTEVSLPSIQFPSFHLAVVAISALLAGLLFLEAKSVLLSIAAVAVGLVVALTRPFVAVLGYLFIFGTFCPLRIIIGPAFVPIYLIDVFLAIAIVGIVFGRVPVSRPAERGGVDRIVLILIVAVMPGFFLQYLRFPGTGIETLYFALRYVLHMGAFFAVSRLVATPDRRRTLHAVLYSIMCINGIWAILQSLPVFQVIGLPLSDFLYGIAQIPYVHERPSQVIRAASGFSSPNDLGGFLAMTLPLTLFHSLPPKSFVARFLSPLALALGGAGLLLSFSRTAIAGLALGLLISALALRHKGVLLGRVPVFVAVFALIAWGLASLSGSVGELMVQRASGYADPLEDDNFQTRITGHYRFANAVADDPSMLLFGQGLRLVDLERRGIIPPDSFRGYVSNSWLLVLMDSGLLAFLAYLFLYARLIAITWRKLLLVSKAGSSASAYVGILVALVALFFTHLIDNYMATKIHMKGFYFAFLGLSVTFLTIEPASEESRRLSVTSADSERRK
jgi:hypothetical protein